MDHFCGAACCCFGSRNAPVAAYDIRQGDIMKAKPKYFEPRPPGSGNVGQHPVIILTRPNAYGWVRVATMSHSHPHSPPTRPASMYNLPIDPQKGESTVSVGRPDLIHISNLKPHVPYAAMNERDFIALRYEICEPPCNSASSGVVI